MRLTNISSYQYLHLLMVAMPLELKRHYVFFRYNLFYNSFSLSLHRLHHQIFPTYQAKIVISQKNEYSNYSRIFAIVNTELP